MNDDKQQAKVVVMMMNGTMYSFPETDWTAFRNHLYVGTATEKDGIRSVTNPTFVAAPGTWRWAFKVNSSMDFPKARWLSDVVEEISRGNIEHK